MNITRKHFHFRSPQVYNWMKGFPEKFRTHYYPGEEMDG